MRLKLTSATDGYKLGHHVDYPHLTQFILDNMTARGSRLAGFKKVVVWGTQAMLIDLTEMANDFFDTDEETVVEEFYKRNVAYVGQGPADVIGTDHIRALHRLGYLPLRFKSVPEGTRVPLRVPYILVENTLPEFFWLPNFFETFISTKMWAPITSATIAHRYRQVFNEYCALTGGNADLVQFQGHDFSMRGMSSIESGAASGAAHLLSSMGTDTLTAIDYVEYYYPGDNGWVGASVHATEHSVMCAGGKEDELETYRRLLLAHPEGILSIVSDTWDLWHVITVILPQLKDIIMARNGTLVIRPDSGDPERILCGDPDAPSDSPARKGVIRLLGEIFGTTENEMGFKALDSHIGAIYGDSITLDRQSAILENLYQQGWQSTVVVLGIGSFTYQHNTRDTFGQAIKATHAVIDDVGYDLYKDPVTDSGEKKSAKGRLAVLRNEDGELYLVEQATQEQEDQSLLEVVWEDGNFTRWQSFAEVRQTLWT